MNSNTTCFTPFTLAIKGIEIPSKFTFPFCYEPHALSLLAVEELQQYLEHQTAWVHNFGFEENTDSKITGKMFGVLVVQNEMGQLGYLRAFSGKLAGKNEHNLFVPPIFDMLQEDGFYRQGENVLNGINVQVDALEGQEELKMAQEIFDKVILRSVASIDSQKVRLQANRTERKLRKKEGALTLNEASFKELYSVIAAESIRDKFLLRELLVYWEDQISKATKQLEIFTGPIKALKIDRKQKSNALQQKLYDQYHFLNQLGETKSVCDIFLNTLNGVPLAGAGECAAPKLLQYAFQQGLKPIAMAEFWWGASPTSAIRKHKNYYPACQSKCHPILGHMLQGLQMEDNPLLKNPAIGKVLATVYEDDSFVIINKPSEFLSVPGKTISDSVYTRMLEKYPEATGPLIVHRLDMSTSGLMVIAKTKEVHKDLQSQFINRTVKKRYVALLEGELQEEKGEISLPLRVDLDNRPRQLVCYEYGKKAKTIWKVIEKRDGNTLVHFYPVTGRTHQLRMHAAHKLGLNSPIVGDDLYGVKANRLHLHAEYLQFTHPGTGKVMKFRVKVDF
ncbi:MAG: RluA family pseudouridine synthase [Flavobacteriaceae bacterium]|nr:RluA family pseudouridine synthase [Flavobacteriaceae bacterium]